MWYIIIIVGALIIGWAWYEIKHPLRVDDDYDTEHDFRPREWDDTEKFYNDN